MRLSPELNRLFCHIHVMTTLSRRCLLLILNCSNVVQRNSFQIEYRLSPLFSFFRKFLIRLTRVIFWRLRHFGQKLEPLHKLKSRAKYVSVTINISSRSCTIFPHLPYTICLVCPTPRYQWSKRVGRCTVGALKPIFLFCKMLLMRQVMLFHQVMDVNVVHRTGWIICLLDILECLSACSSRSEDAETST